MGGAAGKLLDFRAEARILMLGLGALLVLSPPSSNRLHERHCRRRRHEHPEAAAAAAAEDVQLFVVPRKGLEREGALQLPIAALELREEALVGIGATSWRWRWQQPNRI